MNAHLKPGTPPVNAGIMRLELLMRAHEISRRIDERVRRALREARSTTATPESPAQAPTESISQPQLARQMQRGPATENPNVARGG